MKASTLPIFYETPSKIPAGGFLSDEAYAEARVCLPFIGTDAFILDQTSKHMYLPFRIATPARGYWGIGGGWKTGKTPLEAMQKAFTRETGLELTSERFIERADLMNAVMWSTEPIVNLHIPFFVTLSDEEIELVKKNLDPKEYDPSKGLVEIREEKDLIEQYKRGEISDGAIDVLNLYFRGL